MAHTGTEESAAVKELRRRLAAEKMTRTGSADAIAANDNDPEIDEAVARFYWGEGEGRQELGDGDSVNESQTKSAKKSNQATDENRMHLEELIQAIEQNQKGASLTPRQVRLLEIVSRYFGAQRLEFDPATVNTSQLRKIPNLQSSTENSQDSVPAAQTKKPRGTGIIAVAQPDYSSPEAAVWSLFGMDPDVARPNILPDPRGSDGELTSDVSQWTAPALLYDLARAFVTPAVAVSGGQVTDADAQNMALSITGSGGGAARAAPHGGIGMPWAAADKVPRHLARTVDEVVEIYRDTRPVELKEQLALSPTKTLRALRLKNGKVFTWPAEKALHSDAIEILLKEGKIVEADLKGAERLLYQEGVGYCAE